MKYILIIFVLFSGIFIDQSSKHWAANNLKNRHGMVVIRNVLELRVTENHGMVFGINNRKNNSFCKNILPIVRIMLSVVLSLILIWNREKEFLFHLPYIFILSGAIGNIIDSLRFGYVIDFIHIHAGKWIDWPFLYNVADVYICIGTGILLLFSLLSDSHKKRTLRFPFRISY